MSEELLNEQLNGDPAYNDPKYPIQKIAIGQNAEGAPTPITYIDHSVAPDKAHLPGQSPSAYIGVGRAPEEPESQPYTSDQILSTAVSGDNVNYFWDRNGRLIAGSCMFNANVAKVKFGGDYQSASEGNALLAKTSKAGESITDGYAVSSYGSDAFDQAHEHEGTMLNMTRWTLQVNAADEEHVKTDTGKYIQFANNVSPQEGVALQKLPMGYYGEIEGFSDNTESVVTEDADKARIEIIGLDATKIAIGTTYFGVVGQFGGRLIPLNGVTQYFNEAQHITPQDVEQDKDGFSEVNVKTTAFDEVNTGTESAPVYTYYIGEIKNVTP